MAEWGSKKALSQEQEDHVARLYQGRRSPSSGASVTDAGDVRDELSNTLWECKYSGSPESPLARKPTLVQQFEKIMSDAYAEGREPAVALRFYCPDSTLADHDGWIDFAVRLLSEDAHRCAEIQFLEDELKAERGHYGDQAH